MANKKIKLEWIIIGVLLVALVGGSVFFYTKLQGNTLAEEEINVPTDLKVVEALKDYEELEQAYNKAINDIDEMVNQEDMSIMILRENLKQILQDIQTERSEILAGRENGNNLNDSIDLSVMQQRKDMLNMSKEVLVDRLAALQIQNDSLMQSSEELKTQNQKLEVKLEKANDTYEQEKAKNAKLNEIVATVNKEIEQLENKGEKASEELKALQEQKREYLIKLQESNRLINTQSEQINELGSILRKVNVECYFIYEEGNPDEEAKIYLTTDGISRRYSRYFKSKKPNVIVSFTIKDDLFEDGIEKVNFKLFDASGMEIFGTPKSITSNKLTIKIANKNFDTGEYSLELKAGAEDLIIGGKYFFNL